MSLWRSTMLALALGLAATTARAGECTGDAETCGRQEFEAGIAAYQKKDYADAAGHFEAAQKLRPHPVVLFNWALAESKLERYSVALQHFDQVLADKETPKELLPEVEKEKAIAEKNLATLELDAAADAKLFVDDRPMEGATARVDPGERRVRVVSGGKTVLDRSLRVRAGERVQLTVDRTREVVVAPRGETQRPKQPDRVAPDPGPSPLWFYAGAGVTAVLGGVTVWSALDTKKAFDDYERDLPKLDQRQVDARVAAGHDKELRTNLFIGATAVAAVGTAALGLFVVDWGKGREKGGAALYVGPTGLSVAGRF